MLEAVIYIMVGIAIGAGLMFIWHVEDVAERWGKQLDEMGWTTPERVDVRVIHRGVPTEDGGDDLL